MAVPVSWLNPLPILLLPLLLLVVVLVPTIPASSHHHNDGQARADYSPISQPASNQDPIPWRQTDEAPFSEGPHPDTDAISHTDVIQSSHKLHASKPPSSFPFTSQLSSSSTSSSTSSSSSSRVKSHRESYGLKHRPCSHHPCLSHTPTDNDDDDDVTSLRTRDPDNLHVTSGSFVPSRSTDSRPSRVRVPRGLPRTRIAHHHRRFPCRMKKQERSLTEVNETRSPLGGGTISSGDRNTAGNKTWKSKRISSKQTEINQRKFDSQTNSIENGNNGSGEMNRFSGKASTDDGGDNVVVYNGTNFSTRIPATTTTTTKRISNDRQGEIHAPLGDIEDMEDDPSFVPSVQTYPNPRYDGNHYRYNHEDVYRRRRHRRHRRRRRQIPTPTTTTPTPTVTSKPRGRPLRPPRPGQSSRGSGGVFGRNFNSGFRRSRPGSRLPVRTTDRNRTRVKPTDRGRTRVRTTDRGRTPTGKQRVYLKVVVHLGLPRGYQRDLDTAIRTTVYSQRFQTLRQHISPVGSLVLLRDEEPKNILQTFCEKILTPGTTAIVHLVNPFYHRRNWNSARYVASLLATLNIPRITWGPEYIGALDKKDLDSSQLSISPTLTHQATALVSLLTFYRWPFFAVIHTSRMPGQDAFLTSIRTALAAYNNARHQRTAHNYNNNYYYSNNNQPPPPDSHGTTTNNSNTFHGGMHDDQRLDLLVTVEMTNLTDEARTQMELRQVKMTDARVIILYCKEYETHEVLAQASRLGMRGKEYLWILTFEATNKNQEQNAKHLPVGLLGLQYTYRKEAMEKAIQTAANVWLQGLNEAILSTGRNQSLSGTPSGLPWKLPNLQCQSNSDLQWKSGHEFYKFLKRVQTRDGTFNDLGQLTSTNISIYNVQYVKGPARAKKWVHIGRWTKEGLFMKQITWPGGATTPPLGKPKRHFLRIVTREEPPFVEYRDLNTNGSCDVFSSPCSIYLRDANETRLSPATVQKCCTGLSIEILRKLAAELDFEFQLYEVPDFQWGTQTDSSGTWNGIVGELRAGLADMGVSSMTIDEDKSGAVNFSMPYMETGITFIVAIREGAVSATAFLEPYDYPSWCLILLCSVHVTGASIFLFEWLSPAGMNQGRKATHEHRFSLFRAFWLMWAMLFGAAVTTITPRGVSSKFLANIWALFALVFTASYTANLAAFMITKEEYFDLSGMHDWRLQNPYSMNPPFRFGTVPNGTAENNIKKNNQRMYQYMARHSQISVEHAIDNLKAQELDAFIYDASVLRFQEGKHKDCDLITVGNWYATTGYGIAFPIGSPWLDRVNKVILKLQYEGEMDRLKEFWLAGACHMKRKKSTTSRGIGNGVSSATLGILNFTSAFIFLLAGTGLAIVVFAMEVCFFWCGRKKLSGWANKDCCNLVSLSMGMSLSFRDSVREAMEAHNKVKARRCQSAVCDTRLWKATHELRQARSEIDKLQSELVKLSCLDADKNPPALTLEPHNPDPGLKQDYWNGDSCDRADLPSQSNHRDPSDVDKLANQDPSSHAHSAQVHDGNNTRDVTGSASQSVAAPRFVGGVYDDDDDEEARVTLL